MLFNSSSFQWKIFEIESLNDREGGGRDISNLNLSKRGKTVDDSEQKFVFTEEFTTIGLLLENIRQRSTRGQTMTQRRKACLGL